MHNQFFQPATINNYVGIPIYAKMHCTFIHMQSEHSTVVGNAAISTRSGRRFDSPLQYSQTASPSPHSSHFPDTVLSDVEMDYLFSAPSPIFFSSPMCDTSQSYTSDPELSVLEMEAIFGDSPLSTLSTSSSPQLTTSQRSGMQRESSSSTLTASSGSTTTNVPQQSIDTFSLVFDNLDKYVKSFDVRMNHQSKSVHFVNTIAVMDRIDTSHLPCTLTSNNQELDLELFLPSAQDFEVLTKNFIVHVSRLLEEYMPCLSKYKKVTRHIPHRYSKQMSSKSTVVSTTIFFKP